MRLAIKPLLVKEADWLGQMREKHAPQDQEGGNILWRG